MSKRNLFILVFISLILFLLVGCGKTPSNEGQHTKPPELKVLFQNKSIDAVRGTYSWTIDNNDGTKTTTNADSSSPTELVKNSGPLTVSPKSSLTLKFSDAQPTSVNVNIWEDKTTIKQKFINNQLVVPDYKGSIIYEVVATWEKGTASYAFLVDIK